MGKIVKFTTLTYSMGRKMEKTKYDKLVSRLEATPANNYVVREAENLADQVLELYGYSGKSAPTPVIKIAKEFGFSTYQADDIPDDISGNIFVGGNTKEDYGTDKVIIVDAKDLLPHQRFIIAHELAHYLLDYVGNPKYKNSKVAFSRTYPKVNHETAEEIRADRFAAELLMPKKVFLAEYIMAMRKSDYSTDYTVSYLANLFKTKESCIRRRIQEVLEDVVVTE